MLCAYASFIISSSLFKSCIIPVACLCLHTDTERPSLISLAATATSYMEGRQPFIYRCAPRGTRTGPCPASSIFITFKIIFFDYSCGTVTCPLYLINAVNLLFIISSRHIFSATRSGVGSGLILIMRSYIKQRPYSGGYQNLSL